jgi:hypothetical protein
VTWKNIGAHPSPLSVEILFYDETGTPTGTAGPFVPTMNANLLRNGFSRFVSRGARSAAGDRFVAIQLKRLVASQSNATDAIVDSAIVQQSAREFEAENAIQSAPIIAATWTLMRFATENWDYADEFDNAVNFSLDTKIEGVRSFTITAQVTDTAGSAVTGAAVRLRDTVSGAILATNSVTLNTGSGGNFSYDLSNNASVFVAQDANVIAEVYAVGGSTARVAAGAKISSRLIFEE